MTNRFPTDTNTFKWHADAFSLEARMHVPTLEDAQAIAAMFPKSAKVRATTLSYDHGKIIGTVHFHAKLLATGVTGERNEAGIRRWHSFKRNAERMGYTLEHTTPYSNSMPYDEAAAL